MCPNPWARPSWGCQASGGPGSEPASLPLPLHACPLMASHGAPHSIWVHPLAASWTLGRRCGEGDTGRMGPQGGAPGSSVLISDSRSSVFWLRNSCHQLSTGRGLSTRPSSPSGCAALGPLELPAGSHIFTVKLLSNSRKPRLVFLLYAEVLGKNPRGRTHGCQTSL